MMRILLGALLGLVLGSAVVAALGVAFDAHAYLAVLVGGVLAGVLMRVVAGPGGAIYAKGALAALAAALAAVAGPLVATQWFQSQGSATTLEAKKLGVIAPHADEDDAEGGDAAAAEPEAPPLLTASPVKAPLRAPDRNPFAVADVACLVIGCLAAYQIGKGPEPVVPSDEDGEPDDDDRPGTPMQGLPPVD